jgi:OOP family OmpA-OmpF porin
MRRLIPPLIVASILLGGVPLGAAPGLAQTNPTTEQIVNALKPTGNLLNGDTRGIRLAPTAGGIATAAPSGGSARVQTAATQPMTTSRPSVAGRSVNLTVDFATDSAELTPQAMAALDALGRALNNAQLSGYRFRIEGHTDTVGSADYNRALSERRAAAVVAYLTTKFGVAASRLEAVGVGEQGLLVATPPQTPEQRNRRVQVINLGA